MQTLGRPREIAMKLLCTTHHTLGVETWNKTGVRVVDYDTGFIRLLLRNQKEIIAFIRELTTAQLGVHPPKAGAATVGRMAND
jgi:hypothetical protein